MPASKFDDLTNQVFGRLTAIEYIGRREKDRRHMWKCRCECKNEVTCLERNLKTGNTSSCGCLRKEMLSEKNVRNVTHGLSDSVEYRAWNSMRGRCNNKNDKSYHNYGGRGIRVCDGWNKSFENFVADMGYRPDDKESIDRIEVNGHYSCGHCSECLENEWTANCRWATWEVQHNNRRNNFNVTYNERTMTISQWAREVGIEKSVLRKRILNGLPVKEALFTPVGETICKKNHPLTFNGETHTVTQWSKKTGISRDAIFWRIKLGWSVDKILTTPMNFRRKNPDSINRKLTYNDETHSIAKWAIITGLTRSTIKGRIELGWSIEDALTKPMRKQKRPTDAKPQQDTPNSTTPSCSTTYAKETTEVST